MPPPRELVRGPFLALVAGGLFGLAYPPAGLPPVSLFGAALFFEALLRCRGLGASVAVACLMRLAFIAQITTYLWGASPWVYVLYVVNYVAIGAGLGALVHLLRKIRGDAVALAILPGVWVLFEWLSPRLHFLPSHVPDWATALGATPLRRLAPVVGVHGLAFFSALAALLPVYGVRTWRLKGDARRAAPLLLLAGAGLFLAVALHAAQPAPAPDAASGSPSLRVVAVGLAGGRERLEHAFDDPSSAWTPERRAEFQRYAAARLAEIRRHLPGPADLIVLPEDTIDVVLEDDVPAATAGLAGVENNGALFEAYRDFARAAASAVAVGLTTLRDGQRRNSVVLFDRDGIVLGLADKTLLTPGSEYWPLGHRLKLWRLFDTGPGSVFAHPEEQYVPGEVAVPRLAMGALALSALVCLEGQVPELVRTAKARGADLLVFLSNAQQFRFSPEPYSRQVLQLAQVLAAAHAVPIVVAGKQGHFGVIDDRGDARVRTGFEPGIDVAAAGTELAPMARRETVAARHGEYFVPFSALALALAGLSAVVDRLRLRPAPPA